MPNTAAVRAPKPRAKAHRRNEDAYASTLHPGWTVCGKYAADFTERIDVVAVADTDRCSRCWPKEGN